MPHGMELVSAESCRDLLVLVQAYRQAERSFVSRGRGLSFAHLHVRAQAIASMTHSLATDAQPMQGYWATVLGRSIDDFLEDAACRAHSELFESLDHLHGRRRPEQVACAAVVVLARIIEAINPSAA